MTTFEKVVNILVDYKDCESSSITKESTFAQLGLDSLDTVELIMNFEEEFDITIEMNEDIKTVGGIVELIEAAKQ